VDAVMVAAVEMGDENEWYGNWLCIGRLQIIDDGRCENLLFVWFFWIVCG